VEVTGKCRFNPGIFLQIMRKTTKISVTTAGDPVEIQTRHQSLKNSKALPLEPIGSVNPVNVTKS
jgi:hypothetical protein